MLFEIEHRTHCAVADHVASGGCYIRMSPKSGFLQTVHSWTHRNAGALFAWSDGHGNQCHHLTLGGARSELVLHAHGVVETHDHDGFNPEPDGAGTPPAAYCRSTTNTRAGDAVRSFAKAHAAFLGSPEPEALLSLMHAIHRTIELRADGTPSETTADEALARRCGDARDHAHALIAVCRHAGIPARYVSGYRWNGDRHETHSATHAWAEVHVPARGWLSLDAANDCIADARHVRLAAGYDHDDTGPLRGLRGTEESMETAIAIDVLPPGQSEGRRHANSDAGRGPTGARQMQQWVDPYSPSGEE